MLSGWVGALLGAAVCSAYLALDAAFAGRAARLAYVFASNTDTGRLPGARLGGAGGGADVEAGEATPLVKNTAEAGQRGSGGRRAAGASVGDAPLLECHLTAISLTVAVVGFGAAVGAAAVGGIVLPAFEMRPGAAAAGGGDSGGAQWRAVGGLGGWAFFHCAEAAAMAWATGSAARGLAPPTLSRLHEFAYAAAAAALEACACAAAAAAAAQGQARLAIALVGGGMAARGGAVLAASVLPAVRASFSDVQAAAVEAAAHALEPPATLDAVLAATAARPMRRAPITPDASIASFSGHFIGASPRPVRSPGSVAASPPVVRVASTEIDGFEGFNALTPKGGAMSAVHTPSPMGGRDSAQSYVHNPAWRSNTPSDEASAMRAAAAAMRAAAAAAATGAAAADVTLIRAALRDPDGLTQLRAFVGADSNTAAAAFATGVAAGLGGGAPPLAAALLNFWLEVEMYKTDPSRPTLERLYLDEAAPLPLDALVAADVAAAARSAVVAADGCAADDLFFGYTNSPSLPTSGGAVGRLLAALTPPRASPGAAARAAARRARATAALAGAQEAALERLAGEVARPFAASAQGEALAARLKRRALAARRLRRCDMV